MFFQKLRWTDRLWNLPEACYLLRALVKEVPCRRLKHVVDAAMAAVCIPATEG